MSDNQISDALKIMDIGESPITGRIYPKKEIENALKQLQEQIDSDTGCYGKINSPTPDQQTSHVQMDKNSHQLTEVFIEDDSVYGKIRILNAPHGTILKSLVSDGNYVSKG